MALLSMARPQLLPLPHQHLVLPLLRQLPRLVLPLQLHLLPVLPLLHLPLALHHLPPPPK